MVCFGDSHRTTRVRLPKGGGSRHYGARLAGCRRYRGVVGLTMAAKGCVGWGCHRTRGRLVGWQPPRGALVRAVTAQGGVWLGGSHQGVRWLGLSPHKGAFGWVAATKGCIG
ncbi:hypothetical protein Tco_0096166 [Tanacetum coccineum]